jgi:hypothetical protein
MVIVAVIIEEHLKKAVHKISTAICTSSSNTLIHPNFHGTIFSSFFQDQVTFLLLNSTANFKELEGKLSSPLIRFTDAIKINS